MDELEYKKRYKARLVELGMEECLAEECTVAAEFDPRDPEPEDHADDEWSYWLQDA